MAKLAYNRLIRGAALWRQRIEGLDLERSTQKLRHPRGKGDQGHHLLENWKCQNSTETNHPYLMFRKGHSTLVVDQIQPAFGVQQEGFEDA